MNKKIFLLFIFLIGNLFAQNGSKKFTIEEIYSSPKFSQKSLRGIQWIDKGDNFTFLEVDEATKAINIYKYIIKEKKKVLFVDSKDLVLPDSKNQFRIMNYFYSPDERYILFTGVIPARYMKSGGSLYLYEISTKRFFEIDTKAPTMNVKFSPDGTKIGYIKNDNIYVYDLNNMSEKQLTFDGSDLILNGHFDWVYEEEFGINDGWQFSPDGKEIAYWQLDQSPVPEIEIQQFDSLYFNKIKMRYPKAGGKNSLVKIGVVNLDNAKTQWMDIGSETDIYIPRIKWTTTSNVLAIQRMNRLQTKLDVLFADSKTGKSKIIYNEEDTTWVDIESQFLYFTKDKKYFIISSEKDGFKHLYLYNINGELVNQITKGGWEVSSFIEIDEKNKQIYFTSVKDNPIYKSLFRIEFSGKSIEQLSFDMGNFSINASPNLKYFIRNLSNANMPVRQLLEDNNCKIIAELENNEKLRNILNEYSFAPPEFLKFQTSDGIMLNAMMIKPKDFDPTKKYPVLFYNYSGPGSQIVSDTWGGGQYLWHQLLAQEGFIIFYIDQRGTGNRGKLFKTIGYKNLGYYEVNDLIEATKYLSSLGYIDTKRIGIWGWSYGGYIAALSMMNAADYFALGVAVAPVTDFSFYDTIYTERYMSTPQLNPEGYAKGSVIKNAYKLKGKLFLIHGTADDNVHFQNTVTLVDELIKQNKQFNTMFYPGKDHGIYGGKTREQLFTMITNFIKSNL